MKYNSKMKLIYVLFVFVFLFNCYSSLAIALALEKKSSISSSAKYDEKTIKWEGWVRYFKARYQEKKPKTFINNPSFLKQKYKKQENRNNLLKQEENGNYVIPSDIDFYAVIIDDKINILSNQNLHLRNTVDTLNLHYVKPVKKGQGIVSLGKVKEGHCLRIDLVLPKHLKYTPDYKITDTGVKENWIICIEYEKRYNDFVQEIVIKTRKLQEFQFKGMCGMEKRPIFNSLGKDISASQVNTVNMKMKKDSKNVDGHWVVLQDWTQCSVLCGEGVQFQQRICIPPKG